MRTRTTNRHDYIVTIDGYTEIVKDCHTRNSAVERAAKAIGRMVPKFISSGTIKRPYPHWQGTDISIYKE